MEPKLGVLIVVVFLFLPLFVLFAFSQIIEPTSPVSRLDSIESFCGSNSKITRVYNDGVNMSVRCFDYDLGQSKLIVFKDNNAGKIIKR